MSLLRGLARLAEPLLAACFGLLVLHVLWVVLRNDAIEWPFEYREFAPLSFTGALLDGTNPHALEHTPSFTNVYGPVYNLVVWPWAALVGNGFHVHRLVSLFFLLASSALLYALIRRGRGGAALALCAAAVLFLAQVDDLAGLARPDALGLFLFLAAPAVLVHAPAAGPLALAASAGLVALAFFTKPYFGLAAPIGALFLLQRRRRAALLPYALLGLGAFAVCGLVAGRLWPTVFVDTLYLMAGAREDFHSWAHLGEQGGAFVRGYLGLVLAAAAAIWLRRTAPRGAEETDGAAADVRLLSLVGGAAGVAVLALLLGTHTGNAQLYYTQLIVPFLLIGVVTALPRSRLGRTLAVLAFLHALVIRHDFTEVKLGGLAWLAACPACQGPAPYQYGSPVFDLGEENRRSRALVRELIASAPGDVFGGPEVSPLLAEREGRWYDNGLSEFCIHARGGTTLLRAYQARCRAHWVELRRRLAEGEFARVLIANGSPYLRILGERYRLTARHAIRIGYTREELGVFEPIPR